MFSWIDVTYPLVLSHGGGKIFAAENSLAAIQASVAHGFHAVELDVHELADGTFVMHHHWDWPNAEGWVADTSTAECKRILGSNYLELPDVLNEARKLEVGIYLDIKGMTLAGQHRLWKMIDDIFDRRSIVIASFQVDIPVRAAEAKYLASIPFRDRWMDPIRMAQTPVSFLHPILDDGFGFDSLTHEYTNRVHAAGKRVISWLTNDPDEVRLFLNRGCDVILTDDPRIAAQAIGSSRRKHSVGGSSSGTPAMKL